MATQHLSIVKKQPTTNVVRVAFTILGVAALVSLSVAFGLFFSVVRVSSGSMLPTFATGDHLVVETWCFHPSSTKRIVNCSLAREQVVLFRRPAGFGPKNDDRLTLKRIVGIAGDKISLRKGDLFVNGKQVSEPLLRQRPEGIVSDWPLDSHNRIADVVVPFDSVFFLGDNRANSLDSRDFGSVRTEEIVGHVIFHFR